MKSWHYNNSRIQRNELISKIGIGHAVESFAVDRGHSNGSEIHILTSTGLIAIYNRKTLKLCTVLIARPYQITRYYNKLGRDAPQYLVDIAYEHKKKGYNLV